jgi:hypothetical protein
MLAMRPALYQRESHLPVEKPKSSSAPVDNADASPDLAARIAQARRDARRDPAQAAMLLRSWMSDHG